MAAAEMAEACAGCGRMVEGGSEGCRAAFNALLGRDFSDSRFFAMHRLFVDAYSLQHPDSFCVSAKSLAAHLVGLCLIVEKDVSPATGSQRLKRWLDGRRDLEKPSLPEARGDITLADLEGIEDPEQWAEAVRRWATCVWEAYRDLHLLAREWAANG
jgi:hypothetical protein